MVNRQASKGSGFCSQIDRTCETILTNRLSGDTTDSPAARTVSRSSETNAWAAAADWNISISTLSPP